MFNGIEADSSEDVNTFIDNILNNPVSRNASLLPGDRKVNTKEDYIGYIKEELSNEDGSLKSIIGEASPKIIMDLIINKDGDLKLLDNVKDFLKSLDIEELKRIKESVNPSLLIFNLARRADKNSPLTDLFS